MRFNRKLPLFVSPVPDPMASAVDALSLPWENLDAYAFPATAIFFFFFFIKSALDFKIIHSPEFSSHENQTVLVSMGVACFLGSFTGPLPHL